MSTGTFAVDSAALQNQINLNCTGATYKVGDVYPSTGPAQGVVIWVNGAGKGLAVALSDDVSPTAAIKWTNSSASLKGAQYMSLFSTGTTPAGQTNTAAIIANSDCINSTANCAAYQAYHHDNTGNWYLPSQAELMLVWSMDAYNYANRATTGYQYLTTGGSGCYWSSTAYYVAPTPPTVPLPPTTTTPTAWALGTNTNNSGNVFDNIKATEGSCGVRAVRAFTY